ncbi:endonuclease/exonuclease/phosphatase family protein [Flavobacterium nackdongense]|uniref:Endonuclease/exonuclease/phosphatase family protein n=1 Tax=Flavobacterium nackdongense TaxID=2547394 RepID=A0A4P6YBH1_9FLAO|nr:endonuclease/exonuclease/phosphatase family protein [Flavobacterium nackdongense]QBN19538.1 endonuclease/exonuclease/phosphatase family protein [Flavobacterium nackdongense]
MKYVFTFIANLILVFGQGQSLKLMTYNIRLDVESDGLNNWSNRKAFLTSQLHFYEPDIFGVQEAKPNQVVDIASALPAYNYVGIGRDGIGQGESSNIYYKKERFQLVESNTFWLSDTPDHISKGWDAAFNRVCTYAVLKDSKTKTTFWVFNTHLDHQGEVAKTKGIQLILSKIEALNTKKYPVFFMGDFNSTPTENRIISLKKEMLDAREISEEKPFGPTGTFNDFKHNEPVTTLIDYIFISKNSSFSVRKYAVLSDAKDLRYPSDHLPVYIELIKK